LSDMFLLLGLSLLMLSPPMARTSCCDRTVAQSIDVPSNASSRKP
jgi:hypothetical protein